MFENEKVSADDLREFKRNTTKILEIVKQYKSTQGIYPALIEVLNETKYKLMDSLGE